MVFISSTAEVDPSAVIGTGTKIWSFSQIRENVVIGDNCVIGRNVYIGPGVEIGSNCKIQNNALIYEPAKLYDGVFVGPGVVLTNDKHPRATNSDGSLKGLDDWSQVGVVVMRGASIGANSVCVAPVQIGEGSVVGANAVVTKDVKDFEVVVGNPAKSIGETKF